MARQARPERSGDPRWAAIRVPGLVGRERELAALGRALGTPPAIVLIEGEAGIGKTRLIREFLASPAGARHTWVVACCPPFHEPHTLGPVAGALREAVSDVASLRPSALAGALRPLFPEWAAGLPPALEPAEDATAARHRVFCALAEMLARLEVSVLVVEDAHWADEATLEFLLFLASRRPQPVSIVASWRPEDMPDGSLLPRLARLAAGDAGARLELCALDVTQTARMVSSMLADEHVSAEFAAFMHQRTEGLPLAVEESVRLMADRGDVSRRAGRWVRRRLAEIAVPATVRDAVLERAGRLRPDAGAVLRAVAVLTDPADEATVRAVAGLPAGRARTALCEALGSGLLGEDARRWVSFRHVLAGRAVYEAIPGPAARAMHQRAARALERRTPPPAAQIARHFRAAGEGGPWSRFAEQAADLALASGDETAAVTLLRDLIVDGRLPVRRICRLLDKFTFASLTDFARYQDLAGALRALLDAGIGEPDSEGVVRFQLGRVLGMMEDYVASRAELERAIPRLAGDPVRAARAMTMLGWPIDAVSPAAAHLRWLRRAAELSATLEPAERLSMLVDRATALLMLGEQEGWAVAAQVPGQAVAGLDQRLITCGGLNTGDQAVTWGRYADARPRLAAALDLAQARPYPRYVDLIRVTQAHLDWFTGAWDGLAERARALADNDESHPVGRLEAALIVGLLDAAAGARDQAEERLRYVLAERQRRHAPMLTMEPAAALARLELAAGRVEDALAVTREPLAVVATKGIWLWATDLVPAGVSALAAAGRADEAARLAAAFARGLRGCGAPAPRAGLMLSRAVVAEARGEHARAAGLFGRAADAWAALPRPYDALLASERRARCLLADGKPDTALPALSEVMTGFSGLGARGDALRVLQGLRECGAEVKRPWRGRPGYGDQLSPRELDVARLLVGGRTNRDIARELFLSPKTVARHLDSAMRKLGVASRTALAVRVVEAGTVSADHATPAAR